MGAHKTDLGETDMDADVATGDSVRREPRAIQGPDGHTGQIHMLIRQRFNLGH